MLRNKALAQLQKTYDDSYLSCSKAVYYESQGNEQDAMRCWRTALDQIRDRHHSSRDLARIPAKSETEEALRESLRELEIQCQERIDLLEALRLSRAEDPTHKSTGASSADTGNPPESPGPEAADRGWIGQGTVPAITYPELARPALPTRPSLPPRPSSSELFGSTESSMRLTRSQSPKEPTGSQSMGASKGKGLRSTSPEKHKLRTTLRQGRPEDRHKATRSPAADPPEGPSKAATAAWGALTSRETPARRVQSDAASLPALLASRVQTRKSYGTPGTQWDSHTRRLVAPREGDPTNLSDAAGTARRSDDYSPSLLSISAASSALNALSPHEQGYPGIPPTREDRVSEPRSNSAFATPPGKSSRAYPSTNAEQGGGRRKSASDNIVRRKPVASGSLGPDSTVGEGPEAEARSHSYQRRRKPRSPSTSSLSAAEDADVSRHLSGRSRRENQNGKEAVLIPASQQNGPEDEKQSDAETAWQRKRVAILKTLPAGVDEAAARQILNDIVVQGDEVRWSDVAGLEIAKNALREAVVYPFLRPDLFMGLREPARGMLLFGPPGTGKTMLARAVATESQSTFFSISASSLTSKYLGESEKLVRALFALAKALAPSIIFVDEIDSLLSQRSGSGEHEATRRIKTEFLIQWSDLQRAAAGRDVSEKDKERGDASRVLVLAATNMPWAIDEAARRRFVRRQYIPLPEPETRATQLRTLLGQQKHTLSSTDIATLVGLTDGFSGSDITALAKDAAMGPLRSLGEALLHMTMDQIRPIELADFIASLTTIRPSVSKAGLREYEDWARKFGERGG